MFPITSERRFISYTVQDDPALEQLDMLRYAILPTDFEVEKVRRNVTIDGQRVRFGGRMWVYGSGSATDILRLLLSDMSLSKAQNHR